MPLKDPAQAKTRLAASCGPAARARLQRAMADHVLTSLERADCVERVVTVGPGCLWPELGRGVNETLRLARGRVPGAALVINADLPLLRVEELDELGEAARLGRLLLFASWDGQGTNGFLLPAGVPCLASYGPGSLARHQALYRRLGLAAEVHGARGVAADVDTPEDARRALLAGLPEGAPPDLGPLLAAASSPAAGPDSP